jgi:hypothetical protein
MELNQQADTEQKHDDRNDELQIGDDCFRSLEKAHRL